MFEAFILAGDDSMSQTLNKTKIVATIGPASRSSKIIEAFVRQGVSVFRLNFSHGTHEQHDTSIRLIRQASRKLDRPVAIMADLQGPKIRTGKTPNDKAIHLSRGSKVTLTSEPVMCSKSVVSIDYKGAINDIPPDSTILLNDGAIELKVLNINKKTNNIETRVESGGLISSHKGVNFPNIPLNIQSVTQKDRKDLTFILKHDINIVAQSFVRTPGDLKVLNSKIKRSKKPVRVIAKIEKPEAIGCISQILDISDGIMVARGDLGVETSLWKVPILQKRVIAEASRRGKLVIVATQMLESMMQHSSPTRAETTDVANAILDGTDAVMLSGETAVGAYPVEAVKSIASIARATEASEYYSKEFIDLSLKGQYPPHAVCEAAEWASRDLGGVPVCVFSQSGDTALYLSKIRNQSPIYAFSPVTDVVNTLPAAWNVLPLKISFERDALQLLKKAEATLLKRHLVKRGQLVVMISGTSSVKGATNLMRIKRVGEE
ncbi:MAG: pyruvate kinase [Chitinivibrionales bacterium]|nr:pyruvate kinase [Chitinivibrionales bacterium]MBD3394009.1 pyruvate kinase [Chitinivibrionales bacterium]